MCDLIGLEGSIGGFEHYNGARLFYFLIGILNICFFMELNNVKGLLNGQGIKNPR